MNLHAWFPALIALTSAVSLGAQQPGLRIDEDDITIRGCVTRAERYAPVERMPLVWSRHDILVSIVDGRSDRRDGSSTTSTMRISPSISAASWRSRVT